MKYIGYWFELNSRVASNFPNPKDLVDPEWLKKERSLLINYLKSGAELVAYRGFSWCRFKCGISDHEMGYRDLTDGLWVWPEGLHHYIEHHNVVLPDEFIAQCHKNQWSIPSGLKPQDQRQQRDYRFWISWASTKLENGVAIDSDN